jgi:hypothetical protein
MQIGGRMKYESHELNTYGEEVKRLWDFDGETFVEEAGRFKRTLREMQLIAVNGFGPTEDV